ncbi:MAG: Chaperone for flagella basal body P-ring formation [Pseudomonadota bacterium]
MVEGFPVHGRKYRLASLLLCCAATPCSVSAQSANDGLASTATRNAVMLSARQAAAVALQAPPAAVALREPDRRLRPPSCPAGFVGRPAPGTSGPGRVTVEVACPGVNWRTFIAARLEGGSAPSTATTNTPPRRQDPRQPPAVRRNAPVTLTAGTPAFRVVTDGIALADGAMGAWVRVRNSTSGRELEGRVTGEGEVSLDPTTPTMQGIPQVAAEAVDNTSVGKVARRGDDK